jgi:hypothetical protein
MYLEVLWIIIRQISFVITFWKKIYPQDLKNGPERRVLRFSTICAKNEVLNLIINKVTVILR